MVLLITVNEYLAEITQTKRKRVLVEGKTDRIAIQKLLRKYFDSKGENLSDKGVEVDTAERIREDGIRSNREKVEKVLERSLGQAFELKLIGLVDRELRDFNISEVSNIKDELCGHKVSGRLIWTRGHSIENYFLDQHILRTSIDALTTLDCRQATAVFETHFDSALRNASAITLAAANVGRAYRISKIFERVAKTLVEPLIVLSTDSLEMDRHSWVTDLKEKLNSDDAVEAFLKSYDYWVVRLTVATSDTVRWVCHGHIASGFISSFLAACISETNKAATPDERNILNLNHDPKLAVVANYWAEQAIAGAAEHPRELLGLLHS